MTPTYNNTILRKARNVLEGDRIIMRNDVLEVVSLRNSPDVLEYVVIGVLRTGAYIKFIEETPKEKLQNAIVSPKELFKEELTLHFDDLLTIQI